MLAQAAASSGHRVIVATGSGLRSRVKLDGLEWRLLPLGASSNRGIVAKDSAIEAFIAATAAGPLATIRYQALKREHDLLWQPEEIAASIAALCAELNPDQVLVDHVSFASTLAMYATGRPFITLVPGHPSQLPVGEERYGIPTHWPERLQPNTQQLAELERLADRVTAAFTARWNTAIATVAPALSGCDDAFRVHGHRVLYNSVAATQLPARHTSLPADHRYIGPLVREESLPVEYAGWSKRIDQRPQVYVALGTFLSHREDVLIQIVDALRHVGVRAAVAIGSTPVNTLGTIPPDWLVAPQLPQVAMLRSADLSIHHGGNNSVQEALAAGVRQLVLPFSTDQFANAADLERTGMALVFAPNELSTSVLARGVEAALALPQPEAAARLNVEELVSAMCG